MIHIQHDGDGIATLTWDLPGTSANVLNEASMTAFDAALEEVLAKEDLKGIVVTSAKRDFILGGDLKMIYGFDTAEQVAELCGQLHGIFRKLETCGKPVVAALNGATLGGGYELALACHHRILLDSPKAQVGLPEVTLGLLPGGGGTQRLPRLIGPQKAIQPLLEGRKYRPAQALKLGMVDQLIERPEYLVPAAKKWILEVGNAVQPWDKKGYQIPGGPIVSGKSMQLFAGASGVVRQKTYGNYPAPKAILGCVYEGLQLVFDRGIGVETRYFTQLALGKEAKHMIRSLWFNHNAAKAGAARPKDVPKSKVSKVGILGAGMMGAGIAYISANVGIEVVLKDVSLEAAEKGKDYSRKLLQKKVDKGRMSAEKRDGILALITATDSAAALEGCDLVIEAVFEDRKIKAQVTQEAEAVIPEAAIFASNTSTLPITGLAEASNRPEQFIGMHFFSPVDRMQLVEVIVGEKTSDETLAKAIDFILQVRRTPIVVNDSRGFFTSRIFISYVIEGMELLMEGVKPVLIENAAKMAGMPVGPLAAADEVSIELIYNILKQSKADGVDMSPTVERAATLLFKELGRKGKKNGKGFYEYKPGEKKKVWQGLGEHFPAANQQPTVEHIRKRLLHIQALESARCLFEGIVRKAEDADIGSVFGWAFPPFTGGVLSYIDFIGIESFVDDCNTFSKSHGSRFLVPEELADMAARGEGIYHKPKEVQNT